MLLSSINIKYFLYEKRLISIEISTEEKNVITKKKENGRNFGIIYQNNTFSYFLKQLRHNDESNQKIFAYEARFYHLACTLKTFDELLSHLPKFYLFDPYYHIIVTEWVENSKNIDDAFKKYFPTIALKNIGIVLAKLHKIPIPEKSSFQESVPWILTDNQFFEQNFLSKGILDYEFMQELRDNIIAFTIEKCKKMYNHDCLIHGDLKFGNILYQRLTKKIYLIDWELVGMGDALWDLGFLLADVIRHHVLNRNYVLISQFIPLDPVLDDDDLTTKINALINGYTNDWGKDSLEKLFMFTGLALIEKVFEMAEKSRVGLHGIELVQIGKKMLLFPQDFQSLFA